MGMSIPAPNVAPLSLAGHAVKVPAAFAAGPLRPTDSPIGKAQVIIRVEGVNGTLLFAVDPSHARALAGELTRAADDAQHGLTIARDVPRNGSGGA